MKRILILGAGSKYNDGKSSAQGFSTPKNGKLSS